MCFRLVMLSSVLSSMLYAACECVCMDGHVQAVCQKSYEVRPVCTPRVCPLPIPQVAPLDYGTLPPGATSCHQAQIYNENTRRYEWQRVCE